MALREHAALFDTSALGVLIVRKRVIERCSHHLESLLGYGADELIGNSTRVLYASDEAFKKIGAQAYSTAQTSGRWEAEMNLMRKDGVPLPCHVQCTLFDRTAPENGAIFAITDLSAVTKRQRQLEHQTELPNLAHDLSHLLVTVWHINEDRLEWTADPERLLGPRPASGAYPVFRELVHPDDCAAWLANRSQAFSDVAGFAQEYRVVRTDGEVRQVAVSRQYES